MFFADLPDQEVEPDQVPPYFDHPGQLPSHWLPGMCDVNAVVVREHDTAVAVHVIAAYPRGLELLVNAFTAPPDPGAPRDPLRHPGLAGDDLRVGLLWPDGRRADSTLDRHHWRIRRSHPGEPTTFSLSMSSGGGGELRYDWHYWLHPLPPPGPVEVFVRWDSRGIAETSTTLDLSPAVEAAGDAEELWHLPAFEEEPEQGGWHAYAPLGGAGAYSSTLSFTSDEDSGNGLDGQDEDG